MAATTTTETLAMSTLSGCIDCVVRELYASVDECFQAMEAMRQRMEDLERVFEDDYKFLNQNVRKLFAWWGT
jgi:hypothetical protein